MSLRLNKNIFSRAFLGATFAASLMAIGIATGCNSNSKSEQPGAAVQPQTGPAWTLTLKTECFAGEEQCLAKYGFSVNAEGKYQVGPGPQGQVRTGSLSESEFAAVSEKLQAVMPEVIPLGADAAAERSENGVENVSNDSLTLSTPSASNRMIAHNQADEFFYTASSLDSAKALHDAIRDLANNYYRMPFGDACGDAADKIAEAAASFASCQVDSDCVYIRGEDRSFSVVPPSSGEHLLTEDCTAVKRPVVANKLSILGGAAQLEKLYGEARDVCGANFSLSSYGVACYYKQESTMVQPVCVQNRCQARF